jgi:acyl-CoA thioesterase
MDDALLSGLLNRAAQEGYARKLGMRVVDLKPGYAVVEMVPDGSDENIFGMVHGGVIFSLMDEAFQLSCNSHGTVAVALSVNVVYHLPVLQGCRLRAESREVHRSKKTGTYDIKVVDDKGVLIASCQALAYRKKDRLPFAEEEVTRKS